MEILSIVDRDFEFILELSSDKCARKERVFKEHPNYLTILTDCEFHCRFRISKESFVILLEQIKNKLSPKTIR